MDVAQTNIQLYNQLRAQGRPLEDLITARRAYEFMTTLYTGFVTRDGKPFSAHTVGVASILAHLDQPIEIVAVGLLHSIYANADFGDGRPGGAHPARRHLVRAAVGARLEQLLAQFPEVRASWRARARTRQPVFSDDATERSLILVDVVDLVEKYVDLAVLYHGRDDQFSDLAPNAGDLIDLAAELGGPRLTGMLSTAIAAAALHRDDVPRELRSSGPPHLIIPRSCRRRAPVRLRRVLRRMRRTTRRLAPSVSTRGGLRQQT